MKAIVEQIAVHGGDKNIETPAVKWTCKWPVWSEWLESDARAVLSCFEVDCELQCHTVYIETTQASDSSHSDHTDRFQSSLQEAIKTLDLNSG